MAGHERRDGSTPERVLTIDLQGVIESYVADVAAHLPRRQRNDVTVIVAYTLMLFAVRVHRSVRPALSATFPR